ncbi:Mg chelatase, cobalamin biosynthesis protein CobN [Methanomethylovorans hollandica DSM 15978]|uniref:Mg chelatase, cobalamin biosynthesis protein CobN n=1 Tax=Methanomethylovorans hollandica (strain DSM 15978 / NBRC 107637 / DMS1) TaxID=867904 RepID=L0KTU7_METHD|nr:cobaltochelatase subunit CobN [Methanomethylovorans hollandica]AGB48827.1 Mg chelatase, cobalamin biosynthesis protein CobN [Methanomethylovorans hollandica DSM 15978]
MQRKYVLTLVLSVLLLTSLTTVVSAAGEKINITYIAYTPSDALQSASQTNVYSAYIDFTYIPAYNASYSASDELLSAVGSGFLGTQDVIFCDMVGSKVYNSNNGAVNATLQAAHDNGASLLSIRTSSAPSYFDYVSDGEGNDTICTYYNSMGTTGDGLTNAENLFIYLATEYSNLSEIINSNESPTDDGSNDNSSTGGSAVGTGDVKFLFVLGTDVNTAALNSAAAGADISSELSTTVIARGETVPQDLDFSGYSMIFIESRDEATVTNWGASINAAKANGAMVIGYNLSENITLPNADLYSANYTDIERYWVQGGEANMGNMLKFMGQKFSGAFAGQTIAAPAVVQEKVNVTYIINSDTSVYYMEQVLAERTVITDRFNVNVMTGGEAINSSNDFTNEDVIMLYMVGANELPQIKDKLLAAKNNGAQIGMFGMLSDVYGIATIDMANPPYVEMTEYLFNDGYINMENWIRCIGATLENVYIEHSVADEPIIPDDGIYHPDAFPRTFANSTEYLAWYADHGYNASAPTIGIIGNRLGKTSIEYNSEDAIIRELESRGCNVIYTTYAVCEDDVDYFTMNGEVIVDSIISVKGFYLNYNDHEKGIEYLQKYNVPVIKAIQDYYQTPDEFNESVLGLSSTSIPYQVTQPEIDGLTDYIWLAGRVQDEATEQYYYEPIKCQVEWLCDRAIAWAELGKETNADKKITILYYNHEGGKNNIGASYLDIGSSFTLLLEDMQAAGYNIGNGTIPNGSEFIDLFIESRNVGTWAPGELEKVVQSGYVTLLPVDEYLEWYETLPQSVRTEVEDTWGKAPGDVMTYENRSGKYFVIPTIQLGNVNFIPQPTRATLSDESLIYHNSSIPPTHQYLATYFWINDIYDADAMIHFGTHGTQEWLPGNEVGLWRYDYPSIMVAETPVVYPYIMDNVGEGTQAKRRGNAVIIDHLTPPIIEAGLYGDLATMSEKIQNYEDAKSDNKTGMMALYRNSTIQLYGNLSLAEDLEVSTGELYNMTDDDFENFLNSVLEDYLEDMKSELIPYGLHVFGVAPEGEKLVSMVRSVLGDDFSDHIYNVLAKDNGTEEDWEIEADSDAMLLLNATLLNATNVSTAQVELIGLTNANITADLELALQYADNLAQTTREIDQTLRALNAEYIEPGTGNDPIRNPGALPTGKNFYSFDQRTIPDEETEAMGDAVIDAWLENYYASNGTYPNKVAFVMWSVETMRHEGLMEAQIYALLGVELERTSGRITGFKVIPQEEMTHPRIDVLITTSGLYRDTFPYQIELMDTAVRMVAELNETNETNYVRWNSLAIEDTMLAGGYNESVAHNVSMSRVFSEATGTYGTGVSEAVEASDTWENSSEVADLYISRMSNVYGKDVWGVNYEDVFELNLGGVDSAIHSDTSNLYGLIDNDDYYSYFGALGLAVKSIVGESPSMYISDLTSVDNPEIITLSEAFSAELTARYLNPNWITGMMEYDYAGAREMMKTMEYMWGWEATTPDLVTDSDWNKMYETYILDSQNLGLDEFLKDNAYQYQSITARMLETVRKDSWDASDEVVENLVKEYVESVVENGVTCCHHTCGNPSLDEFIQGVMSVPGLVDEQTASEYKKLIEEATSEPVKESTSSRSSSRGSSGPKLEITNQATTSTSNQTIESQIGAGTDLSQPAPEAPKSTPENYVEGYEMTKETVAPPESSTPTFSGSDIVAIVLVVGAAGAVFLGFMRKRKM